jgi:Phage tail tube protein, GTA-gp10
MTSPIPNARRGEVGLSIGGEPHVLRLTLQSLAELESAFGVSDLAALGERFASGRLASGDVTTILGAGLRGGGTAIADADVARLAFDGGLAAALDAATRLLIVTFGTQDTPTTPIRAGEASPPLSPP